MASGEDITDLKSYLHDMLRFISSGNEQADEENMMLLVKNIHYKAVIAYQQAVAAAEEEEVGLINMS